MKKHILLCLIAVTATFNLALSADRFPDGTEITAWFQESKPADLEQLGKQYIVTDYKVLQDSNLLQTDQLQAVIDLAQQEGGGVIVIPKGTFLSGSLFFRQGTHLHLCEGAKLKGSDDISHFKLLETRMEGQTLKYFAALINADGLDGFTVSGMGIIDGNGFRYWRSFWLRRQYNPKCTNLEEMRPRLLYVSKSKNIHISDVSLINSPFWTSHFYQCDKLKVTGVKFIAGTKSLRAPSSDGIDLDVCSNVLIKNCYFRVDDDGIALKGGKGPTADKDPNNGSNRNILIEDNTFNNCPALTLGSESVFTQNVIMRRCQMENAYTVFLIKMRPDTPQHHANILVEDITGSGRSLVAIRPWTQFFDLQGHPEPFSSAKNITIRNCRVTMDNAFSIAKSDRYELAQFSFENLHIISSSSHKIQLDFIDSLNFSHVYMNGKVLATL